jgi:hypothetical protein
MDKYNRTSARIARFNEVELNASSAAHHVMFHCIASIVGAGAMVHPFHSRSRIGWFQQDGRRICTARKIVRVQLSIGNGIGY